MTEPTRPAANQLFGKENWIFVPTIASATLAPTVAEINAASGLDITNMLFRDGAPSPTQNTNLVDQQERFGDTTTTQFVGKTTYTGGEFTYQFNQQGAAASDGVLAWEKFLNSGSTVTGYFCRRSGVLDSTTPVAGQFVDTFPVEIGPSMPGRQGDGESAEGAARATFAITSAPAFKKAVLA